MKSMNNGAWRSGVLLAGLLVALGAVPAAAQSQAPARERGNAPQPEALEVQLKEAEEQLAEAAARVAELSRQRLPDMAWVGRTMRGFDRPVLGVTIGGSGEKGPVEGVTVQAVTPGSAAEEAGLRSGDILTAINDESLSASSEDEANRKLLDFMRGVKEGDTLEIEYLRDGRSGTVEVKPRKAEGLAFAYSDRFHMPVAPQAMQWFTFATRGPWGDMEMVPLTENLGRYFGTDKGLLVVRAPKDDDLKLRDGDVIQRIDGREPQSVAHAMRILGSYQAGEKLEIEIMRDKKREVLSVEMPDDRQGFVPYYEEARPAPVLGVPPVRVLRNPLLPERRI
jgi:S1-C subfamily serine protease